MKDLFEDHPEPTITPKKKCLACKATASRVRILCDACRADPDRAMAKLAEELVAMEDAWKAVQRTAADATQERFAKVLEAHGDAYGPGSNKERQMRIAMFRSKLKATVKKGDELAALVTAWDAWQRRKNDLTIIAVAAVFAARNKQ